MTLGPKLFGLARVYCNGEGEGYDFFTLGSQRSAKCARNVSIMKRIFAEANLP
jgi:hypothetical protein